jgi:hypothetical protein
MPAGGVDRATAELAERTAARALAFLSAQQGSDGRIASETHGVLRPGWSLTATMLLACAHLPDRLRAPHEEAIARAFACLHAATGEDGGIGLDGDGVDYPCYTSAHYLHALAVLRPLDADARAARQIARLRSLQFDESLGWQPGDDFYGAFGFGLRRERKPLGHGLVDIALQRAVLEALRAAGVPATDPAIVRGLAFAQRCQLEDGSFCYTPGPDFRASKAGLARAQDGSERPLGYGTTTADGLRALAACGQGDGAAAAAARAWLLPRATVLPVPGLPLDAAPPVEPALRFYWWSTLAWTAPQHLPAIVRTLAARQHADGSFTGDSDRMKEDDPLVATCLALSALAPALLR